MTRSVVQKSKMKARLLIIILAGIIGFSGGILFEKFSTNRRMVQNMSHAFGTLDGLSRALESEKDKIGNYPKNLNSIDGSSFVTGDYTKEMAERVIYVRTEQGYFMAIGLPVLVFTRQAGNIEVRN